jgi:hypothetical protein
MGGTDPLADGTGATFPGATFPGTLGTPVAGIFEVPITLMGGVAPVALGADEEDVVVAEA